MKSLASAARSLSATMRESARTLSELTRAAAKASKESSSTLYGAFGGCVGMGFAYAATITTPVVSMSVVGPLGTAAGILVGVLFFRGHARFDLERRFEANRMAADEVLARIRALPRKAPASVREALWDTYRRLSTADAMSQPPASPAVTSSQSGLPQLPAPSAAIDFGQPGPANIAEALPPLPPTRVMRR